MIRLRGVSKYYGLVSALYRVDLEIEEREMVLLTGPSGAGKSTLIRCMALAESPDEGEIAIAGRDISRLRAASLPFLRRNIGVVFQDFKLLREWSALANVALALELRGISRRTVRAQSREALERVGLGHRLNTPVRLLSGGEQQRVALARAVVARPHILLADEPTGNLDADKSRETIDLLCEIARGGTTVVVATHDPLVLGYTDATRVVELADGEIVSEQTLGAMPRPIRTAEEEGVVLPLRTIEAVG